MKLHLYNDKYDLTLDRNFSVNVKDVKDDKINGTPDFKYIDNIKLIFNDSDIDDYYDVLNFYQFRNDMLKSGACLSKNHHIIKNFILNGEITEIPNFEKAIIRNVILMSYDLDDWFEFHVGETYWIN